MQKLWEFNISRVCTMLITSLLRCWDGIYNYCWSYLLWTIFTSILSCWEELLLALDDSALLVKSARSVHDDNHNVFAAQQKIKCNNLLKSQMNLLYADVNLLWNIKGQQL